MINSNDHCSCKYLFLEKIDGAIATVELYSGNTAISFSHRGRRVLNLPIPAQHSVTTFNSILSFTGHASGTLKRVTCILYHPKLLSEFEAENSRLQGRASSQYAKEKPS